MEEELKNIIFEIKRGILSEEDAKTKILSLFGIESQFQEKPVLVGRLNKIF